MTHYGFIATGVGVIIPLDFSDAVSAAYDIMAADNVPADTCAKMALAAEESGRDPVAFAEHFVKVRKSFRASKCA
jgi:hypothetical protein